MIAIQLADSVRPGCRAGLTRKHSSYYHPPSDNQSVVQDFPERTLAESQILPPLSKMAVTGYVVDGFGFDQEDGYTTLFDSDNRGHPAHSAYGGHSRTASSASAFTDDYPTAPVPWQDPRTIAAGGYQNQYFDHDLDDDGARFPPTSSTTPETKMWAFTDNSVSRKSSRSSRSSRSSMSTKASAKASTKASAKSTAKATELAPVKEERKQKAIKPKLEPGTVHDEDDPRRSKFLERNRVAASKCRQKKKEWMSQLEEHKFGLENEHSQLQIEYNGLVGEVSRMKNELMSHAGCNDANIDRWLQSEAQRFVQQTSNRYDQTYMGYGSPDGLLPAAYPGMLKL